MREEDELKTVDNVAYGTQDQQNNYHLNILIVLSI